MSELVCGKGFNDKSRPAKVGGKLVKEYNLWKSMLDRCFSEKLQTRCPTYKGCNVSDNFLNYAFFYDWCQEQIGFNKVDEKEEVGVWIKTFCLRVIKHIPKQLVFLCLTR